MQVLQQWRIDLEKVIYSRPWGLILLGWGGFYSPDSLLPNLILALNIWRLRKLWSATTRAVFGFLQPNFNVILLSTRQYQSAFCIKCTLILKRCLVVNKSPDWFTAIKLQISLLCSNSSFQQVVISQRVENKADGMPAVVERKPSYREC